MTLEPGTRLGPYETVELRGKESETWLLRLVELIDGETSFRWQFDTWVSVGVPVLRSYLATNKYKDLLAPTPPDFSAVSLCAHFVRTSLPMELLVRIR